MGVANTKFCSKMHPYHRKMLENCRKNAVKSGKKCKKTHSHVPLRYHALSCVTMFSEVVCLQKYYNSTEDCIALEYNVTKLELKNWMLPNFSHIIISICNASRGSHLLRYFSTNPLEIYTVGSGKDAV